MRRDEPILRVVRGRMTVQVPAPAKTRRTGVRSEQLGVRGCAEHEREQRQRDRTIRHPKSWVSSGLRAQKSSSAKPSLDSSRRRWIGNCSDRSWRARLVCGRNAPPAVPVPMTGKSFLMSLNAARRCASHPAVSANRFLNRVSFSTVRSVYQRRRNGGTACRRAFSVTLPSGGQGRFRVTFLIFGSPVADRPATRDPESCPPKDTPRGFTKSAE